MEELYEQLNNITMESEEDDTDIYTDPAENYYRVQQTVTFLKNGGRVTEEWMEEHRSHILKYYEVFPNFSQTNQEIEDSDFRKIAQETEVILSSLVQSVRMNRFFNVKFYLMLNEHMLKMIQYIFTEDELEAFMSKLSI